MNKHKYEALYQSMYDDLKDADMMIEYACEVKEEQKDKPLADELAKYAQNRLNHFNEFHKLFQAEVEKEPKAETKTVEKCMWEMTHEHLMEWYRSVKYKIEKYN